MAAEKSQVSSVASFSKSTSRLDLLLSTAGAMVAGPVNAQTQEKNDSASTIANTGKVGFDLDRFIDDCKTANLESDRQAAIREVIKRRMENPGEVLDVVGEPTQGGIQSLYRSRDMTILNIV